MHQGHTSPPTPRIEEACRRFERAWQAGDRPRIEEYLAALPRAEQPALLQALLALELTYRRQTGDAVAYDECLQRFPDHADLVHELLVKTDTLPSNHLFGSSVSVALDPAVTAEAARTPPDVPTRLGRYRVTALLGKGGFGIVYKGHDDELNREVAIKVPHRQRVARPEDVEAYIREARLLASLEHAHIVPVYDVGRTEDGLCFVVSKFLAGGDLHGRLLAGRLAVREAAEVAAVVAEALHHAHRRGLIHRDVKPANILLADGKPFLADFGLALREEDFGKGAGYAGTPAYMSPEQARGEGHRVDGRSDIFSLGGVLYEMLTGRRPFRGDTVSEILDRITTADAQPPRQLDDTIPRELERICLKALAKKASERYTTALDLAEDLRHWLAPSVGQVFNLPDAGQVKNLPHRVVPKGLRSFDAADADFFLELLPGPRDREGLPDSLRFWKARIEEPDPDKTFAVGLLYGPSGCGKSSLVKAGLLPRLAGHILAVHVEATAEETETRLLKALRKRCPTLGDRLGLVDTLAALRRGQGLAPGQKVLLVLDQFEQWLHARRHEQDTELVRALRHCDGGRVQALVLVRDDFWLAVSRFMTDLEIDIRQGDNAALVDLFDLLHARKVLAEFGRAFDRLPEDLAALTREQGDFLDQAVSGLAQDGKVISVRLALFAEMVKGKPWQPATLRAVGGTEGVGVTFLEETFSASTANPRHRLHQRAARFVLKALLPERGSDIKGNMRSEQELLEASGYTGRPRDFAELLRILDADLRLITPTDPEGAEAIEARSASKGEAGPLLALRAGRCYQLTHDYLVPSLREWLTRKQKETRRGRAELRLAERAALWNSKPHNRHLPAWWEWLNIRLFTHKKDWTPPQTQMMRKARRYHAVRGAALAVMLVLLSMIGLVIRGRVVEENRATHAAGLVQRLLDADPAQVPAIVAEMDGYRAWADPLLRQENEQAAPHSRQKLHTALALLPVDAGQRDYLRDRLLGATPQQVPVIVQSLKAHGPALQDGLWRIAEKPPTGKEAQRLRAAAALAAFDPDSPHWQRVAGPVVEQLVAENPVHLGQWLEAFRPVKGRLLTPLGVAFRGKPSGSSERNLATILLADYAARQPDTLADLLMDADDKQFPMLFPKLQAHGERGLVPLLAELERRPQPPFDTPALDDAWESIPAKAQAARKRLAKRQANAAVALLRLERPERVWPLLKHRPDPRVRSYLIHRLSPLGADPHSLWRRFEAEADVSARRALLLCLGEFSEKEWPPAERAKLLQRLFALYRNDPDPGLHGAAAWLLGKWGQRDKLKELDTELARGAGRWPAEPKAGQRPAPRRWYVNGQGQTMVLIPGPVTFRMGSPRTEAEREGGADSRIEQRHYRRIGRSFAIAAHEVTVEQFLKFKDPGYNKVYARTPDCPINSVTWYEAAEYCNWLSKQEGIDKDQWCYLPNADDKFAEGMKVKPSYLKLIGYRLPTEAEWEYACRAKAVTARYFGETDELLPHYAWYTKNSRDRWLLPVGTLKPNDLGLFDMLGNDYEWCQERMALPS